jgi:hypothetical protein
MSLHPQVAALLERAAQSPLPPYYADMIHGFITMGRVLDTANAALADCARALRDVWGR